MSFSAVALRVLIASPSDTIEVRSALVQAINEWNDLDAESLGVVLVPTLWEFSTSPEMGARPQGIINRQIVDTSDILVGTFWTRLGTPTGIELSGTVEEVEGFINRGAEALIYFSNQPAVPGNLDPDQLKAVGDYKASLQKRGLYGEYATEVELMHRVQRDLRRAVQRMFASGKLPQAGANADESPRPTNAIPTAEPEASRGQPSNVVEVNDDDAIVHQYARQVTGRLRQIHAFYKGSMVPLVETDDADGLRRLMGALARDLFSLVGTISGDNFIPEDSLPLVALTSVAQEAAPLERFRLYIDGGRSWTELKERAADVIATVGTLANTDWAARPST